MQLYIKEKTAENTLARGDTKDVEIIAPLKYWSTFWGTLEMPLANYEINLILTWCSTCVITDFFRYRKICNNWRRNLWSICNFINAKLLETLQFGFKRIINWNKHQSDPKIYGKKYLNHLIDPGFQGVNRLFVLSFEN